jgi:amino acid transporter
MSEGLELKEVIAMGIGGVVGGGIFAALGVAAELSGNAAFLSYIVAGLIALASGYSYVKMTRHLQEDGGSFTFLEHYVSNNNIAGMVGWILILGYIGAMAMYAYAFGSFASNMLGIAHGSVLRGFISAGIIGLFVGINFLGIEDAGASEDLLVYVKVAILLAFSVTGGYMIFSRPDLTFLSGGVFNKGFVSPIVAIGAIFVSFEGWQLLTYEYSEIKGGAETLRKGVLATILASTGLYVLIALVTTSLVSPENIVQHKETVLAFASAKIFSNSLLKALSGVLVSIAALFSTASAINATLFGTARFSHKIATENELPQVFSFRNRKGVPSKSLVIIGVLTALFTFSGSLEAITTFASLSFIVVFGTVNYVAFKDSDLDSKSSIHLFGLTGTVAVFFLEFYHLLTEQIGLLIFITGLYAGLFVLEFFYFERTVIEEEIEEVEQDVEKEAQKVQEGMEDEEQKLKEEIDEIEEDLDEQL